MKNLNKKRILIKSILYLLVILFALSSCSKSKNNDTEVSNEEKKSEVSSKISDEHDITIPYQDKEVLYLETLETYDLLEALIDYIDKNQVQLITFPANSLDYPSVTMYNRYLKDSKEAVALFKREDCVSVLISTYLTSIREGRHLKKYDDEPPWSANNMWFRNLSLVLASEMCMSEMNVAEKVQLMTLALEIADYYNMNMIMISIMLTSNYIPFVEDIKPMLRQFIGTVGYYLEMSEAYQQTTDIDPVTGYSQQVAHQANDLIKSYAKQFINDNK